MPLNSLGYDCPQDGNHGRQTTTVYYTLDEQMTTYHDKDDKLGQAEEIAHDLIKHADLPLLIRCDYDFYRERRGGGRTRR